MSVLFTFHPLIVASVKLPPEKFATPSGKDATSASGTTAASAAQELATEPKKFILNSGEELFAELRDKNFNAVGSTLSRKAKLITAQFDVSTTWCDVTSLDVNVTLHGLLLSWRQGT